MAQFPRKHQIWNAATLATGTTTVGPLQNLARDENPTVVVILSSPNAPAGTTPSMTVTVYAQTDTQPRTQIGQFTAITGAQAASQRLAIHDVLEENIIVEAVITGAGASFTSVSCYVMMTAPDA